MRNWKLKHKNQNRKKNCENRKVVKVEKLKLENEYRNERIRLWKSKPKKIKLCRSKICKSRKTSTRKFKWKHSKKFEW